MLAAFVLLARECQKVYVAKKGFYDISGKEIYCVI